VVLDDDGDELLSRPIVNDESVLEQLLVDCAAHGTVGLATDQPGSIAQFAIAVAAVHGVPATSGRRSQIGQRRSAEHGARWITQP